MDVNETGPRSHRYWVRIEIDIDEVDGPEDAAGYGFDCIQQLTEPVVTVGQIGHTTGTRYERQESGTWQRASTEAAEATEAAETDPVARVLGRLYDALNRDLTGSAFRGYLEALDELTVRAGLMWVHECGWRNLEHATHCEGCWCPRPVEDK